MSSFLSNLTQKTFLLLLFLGGTACGQAGLQGLSGSNFSSSASSQDGSSVSGLDSADSSESVNNFGVSPAGSSGAAPGAEGTNFMPVAGGPIDIPITIAKVTRPNPKMMLIQAGGKSVLVQGLPGAASPTSTKTSFCQVAIYDQKSGKQLILPVNEDGSFEGELQVDYLESSLAIGVIESPVADNQLVAGSVLEQKFVDSALVLEFDSSNQYRWSLPRGGVVAFESITLESGQPYILEGRAGVDSRSGELASGSILYQRDENGVAQPVATADFTVDELIPAQFTVVARSGNDFFRLEGDHFVRIFHLSSEDGRYHSSAINPVGRFLTIATDTALFMLHVGSGEVVVLHQLDVESEWIRKIEWLSNDNLKVTYTYQGRRGLVTSTLLLTPDFESESIWRHAWDNSRYIE